MKATITQLNAAQLPGEWQRLAAHIAGHQSELLLLPEMSFAPWFCTRRRADEGIWRAAVEAHERWLERLPELGAQYIIGTAPRSVGAAKYNSAYLWTAASGKSDSLRWIHHKTYLPNDKGYWEANWYDRAPIDFQAAAAGGIKIGISICTEIWFMQHARQYSRQGIHLLLNPRSTPHPTNAKWLAGGQSAAVIAGAYCLSSNHSGQVDGMRLGGGGWICDPDGKVLAATSDQQPFVTLTLDMQAAQAAKSTYPRYVDDSPL